VASSPEKGSKSTTIRSSPETASLVSLGPGPNESGIAPCAKPGRRYESYRYVIHAYEDGWTTVLTDGAEALGWDEELAREFPDR
jgi:hypothetical protein